MITSMGNSTLQELLDSVGLQEFKLLLYNLSESYDTSVILDSCSMHSGIYKGKYEFVAAFGCEEEIRIKTTEDLEHCTGKWCFGVLAYDLKNEIEDLQSSNSSFIEGQTSVMLVPEIVLTIDRTNTVKLSKGEINPSKLSKQFAANNELSGLKKQNHITKEEYIPKIEEIKELILDGQVYELNYCVQHQYIYDDFDPLQFQLKLIKRSPVPMASFYKHEGKYLCGASMERYLKKDSNKLISQPIKGTIKKGASAEEDAALKTALYHSEKDRAENVMIVDLVRNDLGRICETGSILVDELFGIYSYLQVHQMISTVSGKLNHNSIAEIIKASFPMGSMTGAPKVSAMKHIDSLENFKRGWYSGALGYIEPNGDMDLNVVIRSLICDTKTKRIAYSAGGAITIDSIPESEWLECLLKTKAIEDILIH